MRNVPRPKTPRYKVILTTGMLKSDKMNSQTAESVPKAINIISRIGMFK